MIKAAIYGTTLLSLLVLQQSTTGLIESVASMGLGAVIAVIVLIWKRADDKAYQSSLQRNQDNTAQLTDRLIEALEANVQALVELRRTVEADAASHEIERMLREMRSGQGKG